METQKGPYGRISDVLDGGRAHSLANGVNPASPMPIVLVAVLAKADGDGICMITKL